MHLERSNLGIVLESSNDNADRSLAGLIASDQVQRQPAWYSSCSATEVKVFFKGTSARGSRVLLANHSLAGWTAPWGVQQNNARVRRPNVECLKRSERKIACGLMVGHTNLSLAGMIAPCQMRGQPANCSASIVNPSRFSGVWSEFTRVLTCSWILARTWRLWDSLLSCGDASIYMY